MSNSTCKECKGHCLLLDVGDYVCLNDMEYFFCGDYFGAVWLFIIVFWLINTVALIVSRIIPYKTPLTTILLSYVQLCFTAFFIGGSACIDINYNSFGFLISGVFGLVFLFMFCRVNFLCGGPECSCCKESRKIYKNEIAKYKKYPKDNCCRYPCCCYKWGVCCSYDCCIEPYDLVGVVREMKYDHCTFDELKSIYYEDAVLPPLPYQHGEAYHVNHGSDDDTVVVTYTHDENIPYESWQENGHLEGEINACNNIVYTNTKNYTFIDMDGNIEEIKALCQNDINNHDAETRQSTIVDIPGMSDGALYIDDDDCIIKCCSSCFCKHFLYNFAFLLGFAPIIDVCWRGRLKSVIFHSDKNISSNADLRTSSGQRDELFFKTNHN